jgi:hypothetical protein
MGLRMGATSILVDFQLHHQTDWRRFLPPFVSRTEEAHGQSLSTQSLWSKISDQPEFALGLLELWPWILAKAGSSKWSLDVLWYVVRN